MHRSWMRLRSSGAARRSLPADPEPVAGSALDQAGLRDGLSIIRDYLEHGEAGVAFHHLVYMITEPGLSLSQESCSKIRQAGQALGFPESAYAEACG